MTKIRSLSFVVQRFIRFVSTEVSHKDNGNLLAIRSFKRRIKPMMCIVVKRRRWRWLGHMLRMKRNNFATALTWRPDGKRNRGRPKTTWLQAVEAKRTQTGWKEEKVCARDRNRLKRSVGVLCAMKIERKIMF